MNEEERYLRFPGSKWTKHLVLSKDERIRSHLPRTGLLAAGQLDRWLDAYPVVYLKPVVGGGGRGVIRIERQNQGFLLSLGTSRKLCFQKRHLQQTLRQFRLRRYIIQRGINLLRIDGRPIDFRLLLLKENSKWTYIGLMGKMAAKNMYVTNHVRGGTSIRFREALQQSCGAADAEIERMETRLKRFGELVAQRLNEHFVNLTELGLDIAIDTNKKFWLLEANSRPQYELFRDHEDGTLYERIERFMKRDREQP